ncbi:endonuclease [Chryseobacterium suipulveris]|uniref:Endonuclease n=1 Tax=Chryseobacterium suipulveris TaxID=2929800 RepID=A0ABY4BN03_9FLAO|nr:endonuclease [Chryseobacterium suipulveris]UOE40154.1 endonuclease [Chryseobacterium suipulveris]
MKKTLLFICTVFSTGFAFSQIPPGYYNGTETLTGYALKTKLNQIISNGALDLGYSGLWTTYYTSDRDKYYENNQTLLDMYSEKPNGPDAYEYIVGTNQCGSSNQNVEGYCYNREHSLPKSYFGGQVAPMANDAHFVIPSDYFVNSNRGNYPYGEIASASWTSTNGTKIGPSTFPGYAGTVFEPINEFKGDIARMQLYFITRYEDKLASFAQYQTSSSPLDGTTDRGFKQWYINLLLKWAAQDPVSQREIDRNNAVYARQKNRNPFIDHPEWISMIWTSTLSTQDISRFDRTLTVFPNPVRNGQLHLSGYELDKVNAIQIYTIDGKLVQTVNQNMKNSNTVGLKSLEKGIYFLKTNTNQSVKFIVE